MWPQPRIPVVGKFFSSPLTGKPGGRFVLAVLWILVVLAAGAGGHTPFAAVRTCTQEAVRDAMQTRSQLREQIETIDGELSRHQLELRELSRNIRSAREARSNPLKRRKLEQLLRESRTHAGEMRSLRARRGTLNAQVTGVEDNLRVCLSDSLVSELRVLVEHVRARRFDAASTTMASIREIESVLEQIRGEPSDDTYPEFSDAFVEDALASPSDRIFLADAIQDLLDQALADSARHERSLHATRSNLELKRDLLRLVSESTQSSFDGGEFFEGFGDEQVRGEILQLEGQERAIASALAGARHAVAYYRERLERLRVGDSADE